MTSVVSLDVNPSIELRVNSREKVVSCQALNQEAQAVLEDMDGGRDLKGVKADVAVNAIVGSLVRCGYLDSLSSAILISVEDKDQARAQRLQQELTGAVDGALAAGDSQAAVLSQTVQQDKELEKQAKANNISTGKAALIRQAMALNGSLTFEGLAQLSVEELRDLIEAGAPGMPIGMQAALEAAARYAGLTTADITDADVDPELDENPAHYEVEFQVPGKGELEYKVEAYTGQVLSGPADVTPSVPAAGDVGLEAAKSAALKHAGLSTAVFTKAERDYDDGRLEYELEFHTDSTAYEVTVDAATGRVQDYEKENLRGGTGSTDIGAQAAKAAALKHAGLSESQVRELQAEWDNENGRAVYEVEFKSGGMEYDYVIDAATGAVLDHEVERDD